MMFRLIAMGCVFALLPVARAQPATAEASLCAFPATHFSGSLVPAELLGATVSVDGAKGRVTRAGDTFVVELTEPIRFRAHPTETVRVFTHVVYEEHGIRIEPDVMLDATPARGDSRLIVHDVPETIELRLPCDAVHAGRFVSRPNVQSEASAAEYLVRERTPIWVSSSGGAEPIAVLLPSQTSVRIAVLATGEDGLAHVRVHLPGVLVEGYASFDALILQDRPRGFSGIGGGESSPPFEGIIRREIIVPAGTPIYGAPAAHAPWATTAVPMRLFVLHRPHAVRGALEELRYDAARIRVETWDERSDGLVPKKRHFAWIRLAGLEAPR